MTALLDRPAVEERIAPADGPPDTPVAADDHDGRGGDWPNTTRVLPWLVACFVTMLFLVPFDSIELPVSTPVDSKLDRVVLAAIALVWIAAVIRGGPRAPRFRFGAFDVALIAFVLLACLSVVVNMERLVLLDELGLSIKKLALLMGYAAFFYMVATVVRATEVRRFALLVVALAVITALGTIYEYRTGGGNLFYDWAARVPMLDVKPPPGLDRFERPDYVGPTRHGLALTAMLVMALPFAIVGALEPSRRRNRILYGLAVCLILAGTTSTLRKSAVVVPAVAVVTLVLFQPRGIKRMLPLAAGMIVATKFLAPGALGQLAGLFTGSGLTSSSSTLGRTADYAAVTPDILTHPALGRGFGSYDPGAYRLLDNQYLNFLIEIGVVGSLAYAGIGLVAMVLAHRAIRAGDPLHRPSALATVSGVSVFLVSGLLFDAFAFPQVTYTFLLVVALGTVAVSGALGKSTTGPGAQAP